MDSPTTQQEQPIPHKFIFSPPGYSDQLLSPLSPENPHYEELRAGVCAGLWRECLESLEPFSRERFEFEFNQAKSGVRTFGSLLASKNPLMAVELLTELAGELEQSRVQRGPQGDLTTQMEHGRQLGEFWRRIEEERVVQMRQAEGLDDRRPTPIGEHVGDREQRARQEERDLQRETDRIEAERRIQGEKRARRPVEPDGLSGQIEKNRIGSGLRAVADGAKSAMWTPSYSRGKPSGPLPGARGLEKPQAIPSQPRQLFGDKS